MAFSEDIKMKAMIACGRCCCLCHRFRGNKMEVHHIKAHADGGEDTFENAIPLCFDCHAEVRQYDPRHPKGIKYSEKELIIQRDNWYEKVKNEKNNESGLNLNDTNPTYKFVHQQDFQNIMLYRIYDGNELIPYLDKVYALKYDHEAKIPKESQIVGDFVQYVSELMDINDILGPSEKITAAQELSESITNLDNEGFWVFVGIENQKLLTNNGSSSLFPTLLLRVVKKTSSQIIKSNICFTKESK